MGEKVTLQDVVRLASETAARTAVEEYRRLEGETREKQKGEASDSRLHNIKLLLRNYRLLKAASREAVYEASQLNEGEEDIEALMQSVFYKGNLKVESISRSAVRTRIIIEHIDRMIEQYRVLCSQSASEVEQRRYQAVRMLYIDDEEKTAEEVAEALILSKRNLYRDIDAAAGKLATLMFGFYGGLSR